MSEINTSKETIITDIDGCLLLQDGSATHQLLSEPKLLPNVKEKFDEWSSKGCFIIIVTARKESSRDITEKQLKSFGLFWDHLIMGLPSGKRTIINDLKPNSDQDTAVAINVKRNAGL
jgi:hypothetical protein